MKIVEYTSPKIDIDDPIVRTEIGYDEESDIKYILHFRASHDKPTKFNMTFEEWSAFIDEKMAEWHAS